MSDDCRAGDACPSTGVGDAGVPSLLGNSPQVVAARCAVEAAGRSRVSVLVLAEPGLDPEGVAREVHAIETLGSAELFVAVDCGRQEPDGAESKLLGGRLSGRRGAATPLEEVGPGAALMRAAGGTLYLENVTALAAQAQARLTRVVRDGEMLLTGSERAVPLDARLVSSATMPVEPELDSGRLRPDLHRLLSRAKIQVPSLRARPEDIPAIVGRLASDRARAAEARPVRFTDAALGLVASLPWRGNIVELRRLVDEIQPQQPDEPIRVEEVFEHVRLDRGPRSGGATHSLRDARRRFEREYVTMVLQRHGWRMNEAARTLGLLRSNLYRKVRQLGIRRGAAAVHEE